MAPTAQQLQERKVREMAGKTTTKARVTRYLKSIEPQLARNKSTLLLRGSQKASNVTMQILKEIRALQAPAAKLLTQTTKYQKNEKQPPSSWDDPSSIEFLTTKNDCALFVVATHNKKRPHNLIFGRTYDRRVLDMVELGVTLFRSMTNDYGGSVPKKRIGSKPLLIFQGDVWTNEADYRNLQNLLIDFYRGDVVDKIAPNGIDHVIVFSAVATTIPTITSTTSTTSRIRIHQRTYHVQLKKGGNDNSTIPIPLLTPCGPDMDWILRRTNWADPELAKAARPTSSSSSKKHGQKKQSKKNQSTNVLGETMGRLHIVKQNVDQMGGRKIKALRRAQAIERAQEQEQLENDLAREKEQEETE
jgi:ribosome production factor 2